MLPNLSIVVCLLCSAMLSAQDQPSQVHVNELMTAAEFKAAGLDKLSTAELARLDAFLESYTLHVIRAASGESNQATTEPSPSAIESQIEGEFEGWSGETIFKLTNGQIWQQSEYDYNYEYAYSPDITIYRTSSCWRMKVKDVEDTICVRRLK